MGEVEKTSDELQSYVIGGWEGQEAGAEKGLQELIWEATELCTEKCHVNQKYSRISN